MIQLNVTPRTAVGKTTHTFSKDGIMPAVVYGPKQEALSITLSVADFTKILRDEGETSVVTLEGLGAPMQVMIHEVDRNPVTNAPRHADFYAIEKGAKVEVAIPLSFVGESAAVKAGANLVKVMHELEIEAAPDKLPHEIEVDISGLNEIGDQIHVSDLKIPAGVTVKVEGDEVVAVIQAPAEEDAEAPVLDMSAIEVEQKGKAEGEEEAA
jgi:large subunit ribosomal protein L25